MLELSKSVKTDRGMVQFELSVPEITASMTQEEMAKELMDTLKANAHQLSPNLTISDIYTYGLDLKVRAKLVQQNSNEGGKTKDRQAVTVWVMTPGSPGNVYRDEVLGLMAKADVKGLNARLDRLLPEMNPPSAE